jgi:hypothetical protein
VKNESIHERNPAMAAMGMTAPAASQIPLAKKKVSDLMIAI